MTTTSVSSASARGAASPAVGVFSTFDPFSGRITVNVGPRPTPALDAITDPPCRLRQVLDDRQAETEAAVPARGGRISLLKALEDMREDVGRDALAAVGDLDVRVTVHTPAATHARVPSRGRELDGVADQVPHHLLQPDRVAVHVRGGIVDARSRRPSRAPPTARRRAPRSTTAGRSTGRTSRGSVPDTIRLTSRRSSTICVLRLCVAIDHVKRLRSVSRL